MKGTTDARTPREKLLPGNAKGLARFAVATGQLSGNGYTVGFSFFGVRFRLVRVEFVQSLHAFFTLLFGLRPPLFGYELCTGGRHAIELRYGLQIQSRQSIAFGASHHATSIFGEAPAVAVGDAVSMDRWGFPRSLSSAQTKQIGLPLSYKQVSAPQYEHFAIG
jgi:hypothetical protein